jgi:hypothetical protein
LNSKKPKLSNWRRAAALAGKHLSIGKMISSATIGSGVSPIEDAELIVAPLDQEGVIQ